jgi:heptosyltransferase-2
MPLAGKRVLIFQSTRYLGDFLLTLPAVRAAKEAGAIPILLSHEKFEGLAGLLGIETVCWDKDGAGRGLRGMSDVVRRIKAARPQVAILPHKSPRSAIVAFSAGIPERIGFSDSPARALYTASIPYEPGIHEVVRFQKLLLPAGLPDSLIREEMWFPNRENLAKAGEAFAVPEPFVLVAPGASWRVKRWSPEGFAAVARHLSGIGFRVIITGGKGDVPLTREVASLAPGSLDLAGRLSLPEFMGLVGLAKLVLSGDSAPVHAAGVFGTPCVAVYGPTVKEMGFWPLSPKSRIVEVQLNCRPCKARAERPCPLGHHNCMRRISPEMVIRACEDVL